MTLLRYLQEDGAGSYANYCVSDLVPSIDAELDLLFVLESPHIDELRTGIPLSGDAGQAALRVLMPLGAPPEALGPFIANCHAAGDFRVGVMNISRVPLQLAAYRRHPSRHVVAGLEWDLLEQVRTDAKDHVDDITDKQVQSASRLLLPNFQFRLSRIRFSSRAAVVPAGKFAQRHWNSLATRPQVTALPVPHPSNGWWTRATAKQDLDNLAELKRLFELSVS